MRDAVVKAVRTWVGTPYHHQGRVKGGGADCGQIILLSFAEVGLVPNYEPGFYTCDWHLHRDEDRYLAEVEKWLVPVDDDLRPIGDRGDYSCAPGDVIVFRVGRTYSHGAIVTQWPNIVHAYLPSGIVEEVDIRNTPMAVRPARVYTHEGFDK